MRLKILYFGPLRPHTGCGEEVIDLPDEATVKDMLDRCCAAHPALAAGRASLFVSVDREFARPETPLRGAGEVAVMPPLSGGCR